MEKIYPEEVKKVADSIVAILKEDGFFNSDLFQTTTFAEKYFRETLLEKFLSGRSLDLGEDEEMSQHLDKVMDGSVLYELKTMGLMDSYEDEDTKEIFFLTEKGKIFKKENPGD
jgi:hypothetical protein